MKVGGSSNVARFQAPKFDSDEPKEGRASNSGNADHADQSGEPTDGSDLFNRDLQLLGRRRSSSGAATGNSEAGNGRFKTVTNALQLQQALKNASPNDTVILGSNISTNRPIIHRAGVTLDGAGYTITFNNPGKSESEPLGHNLPALVVGEKNTTTKNLKIDGLNINGKYTLIQLQNSGGSSANGATFDNVTLSNAAAGIRNRGVLPQDLTITESKFRNLKKGIDLSRDSLVSDNVFVQAASRKQPDNGKVEFQYGGSLNISNNSFFNQSQHPAMVMGINIDAGNDGNNPTRAPGYGAGTDRERQQFNNDVTQYSNAVISGNHGLTNSDTIKASQFGIALARVGNILVTNNKVETVGKASGTTDFSSGINVENMSHNIILDDNLIRVSREAIGKQNNQGISVLSFQDHGNSIHRRNASTFITIKNNTIEGYGMSGILAVTVRDLIIGDNDFSKFTHKSGDRRNMVSIISSDDNDNGNIENHEKTTFSAFDGSLVSETKLFDRSDPEP